MEAQPVLNRKILKQVTESLIRESNPKIILQVKANLEELEIKRKLLEKPLIKKRIITNPDEKKGGYSQSLRIERNFNNSQKQTQVIQVGNRRLTIPEPRLPPQLAYLKPTPTGVLNIDLGKLNFLLKDPSVKGIECNGPEIEIIAKTISQDRSTGVFLTQDEINQVINIFSIQSRIPVEEGVFRVVLGNLSFSAIISDVIGSKFIIKKLIVGQDIRR